MALKTKLNWVLYIGRNEPIHLDEDLLEYSCSENIVDQNVESFYLPQLLQEIYYVDQLNRSTNLEDGKQAYIDSTYDYIRVFHGRILELLHTKRAHLNDTSHLDAENDNKLQDFSGYKAGQYVEENLSEPYITRNAVYSIFNMLPSSYRFRLPHYARRDIIASYKRFEKYWNKGIALLCELQNDIHTITVDELKTLLWELSGKNRNFLTKYLGERGSCFSLTEVKKNAMYQDVICFSGQQFSKTIIDAISCIEKSGRFRNPFIITKSDNVRYYICPDRYVTYADACKTNKSNEPRMFSCCERKTIAEYDWQDVESYVMIVKYHPCELCQLSVHEHTMKYRGRVKAGVKLDRLEKIPLFNAIAEEIYVKTH